MMHYSSTTSTMHVRFRPSDYGEMRQTWLRGPLLPDHRHPDMRCNWLPDPVLDAERPAPEPPRTPRPWAEDNNTSRRGWCSPIVDAGRRCVDAVSKRANAAVDEFAHAVMVNYRKLPEQSETEYGWMIGRKLYDFSNMLLLMLGASLTLAVLIAVMPSLAFDVVMGVALAAAVATVASSIASRRADQGYYAADAS